MNKPYWIVKQEFWGNKTPQEIRDEIDANPLDFRTQACCHPQSDFGCVCPDCDAQKVVDFVKNKEKS